VERVTILSHVFLHEGCPLRYALVGDPQGPLVSLIHGAATDWRIFAPQLTVLAERFRVLVWDMRGHGRSRPSGDGFSISRAANDLVALLDHLGYATTTVVGVSLGGNVAQEVVRRFPERITALVLLGSTCNTLPVLPAMRLARGPFIVFVRTAPIGLLRRFLRRFAALTDAPRQYVYRAFLRVSASELRMTLEEYNVLLLRPSLLPGYRISHPLLLVHGDRDWTRWSTAQWAAREPHCQYVVIPGAGHLANWDQSEAFNEALIRFLEQMARHHNFEAFEALGAFEPREPLRSNARGGEHA
jgi:3-oxoadipate enol-lactonase